MIYTAIPTKFEAQSGTSNYTKLTPGKHRLRVLGDAISGWEWWSDTPEGGRTPKRIREDENPPVALADQVKKFLAFPVWNYALGRVQVLEVAQPSIQRELIALEKDKDWGDLQTYDIEIDRTGVDKMTTRYRVTPKPVKELPLEVVAAVEAGLPVLEALFESQDPFNYNSNAPKGNEEVKESDLPF